MGLQLTISSQLVSVKVNLKLSHVGSGKYKHWYVCYYYYYYQLNIEYHSCQ